MLSLFHSNLFLTGIFLIRDQRGRRIKHVTSYISKIRVGDGHICTLVCQKVSGENAVVRTAGVLKLYIGFDKIFNPI